MSSIASSIKSDTAVTLLTAIAIILVAVFLQNAFASKQVLLFIIGAGLGISLYHASFGFTGGWRNFIRERRSAGIRAQLLLFAICTVLFFPILGEIFPQLNVQGANAPVGVSIMVGSFLFGIGMQLGGGCGSGTLFTVGGGHVRMLITLSFFIVGAFIGSMHLHWWLSLPSMGTISFIQLLGWIPALLIQLGVLAALYIVVIKMEANRNKEVAALRTSERDDNVSAKLLFGPWPLWWGAISIAILSFITLLVAGHTWSITFAFGLWGAKIWAALGGNVAAVPYWSSGYPSLALEQSVLADTTSLMNFGIILGAVMAAALAGKFAPASKIKWNGLVSAVIGGLLLGYGARLAFGCNIGALFAGISSGSLHGWLWLVTGFIGNIVGVHFRSLLKLDQPN